MIFPVFCCSDGIFSFGLSINSTSCLCLIFVLHIPFQNTIASSAFGGFVLSPLPSRFMKNFLWLVSKFLLSWNFFILLSYRFTLVAFAVILCFSFSITNVNSFLLSPYAHTFDLASLFLSFCPFYIFLQTMLLFYLGPSIIYWYLSGPFFCREFLFFFLAFDFFMPTSSPTIFIAACMTFLPCVKPVIFTCSNTLFMLITSSLISFFVSIL